MFRKVFLIILIGLCSNPILAQSTRIKSIAQSSGKWDNQLIFENPWASFGLWGHFTENQNTFAMAVKTPLLYFGPFLTKGLLSEIYHPLTNSAASRWFNEKMEFSADMSFSPGSSQLLFLGKSSGGYILHKAEKPLISGIIIDYPLTPSINVNLHFSQTQTPEIKTENWYFIQKPLWGRELYHPALGLHYENSFFRFNVFILAALSSLGENAYCRSFQMELKQKAYSVSLYAGKKDSSFINPFSENNESYFESHGFLQWKPHKALEFKQKLFYELDWPENPLARFYPGKTGSESQIHWKLDRFPKKQFAITGNFMWTRSFDQFSVSEDHIKTSLDTQLKNQSFQFGLSSRFVMEKTNSWQIKNIIGFENGAFKGQFSQNWTLSKVINFEYSASVSWKKEKTRLFMELKTDKPFQWGDTDNSGHKQSDFLEYHRLSLGWETQVDSKAQIE